MSHLATSSEDASGATAGCYDADRTAAGYVASSTKTFSPRHPVFAAWKQLRAAIKAGMELSINEYIGEECVRGLWGDPAGATVDPIDRAITDLAVRIARSVRVAPDGVRGRLTVGRPIADR